MQGWRWKKRLSPIGFLSASYSCEQLLHPGKGAFPWQQLNPLCSFSALAEQASFHTFRDTSTSQLGPSHPHPPQRAGSHTHNAPPLSSLTPAPNEQYLPKGLPFSIIRPPPPSLQVSAMQPLSFATP